MRVRFPRLADHQRGYAVVERDDGVVYRMDGFTVMGPDLPHDVRHLIVERELRVSDGIFGAIAAGTVWTSMHHLRGRRPPHSADRSQQLKKTQQGKIRRAELLANLVEAIAALDDPSPGEINQIARMKLSVVPVVEPGADPADVIALPPPAALAAAARALQVEAARWARLRVGDELVYEWPPVSPASVRTLRPVPRQRDGGTSPRQPHRR
ncbi:MAG TPA: hypothetical protein VGG54_19835 [Trebonia sp.]|jgi:hypothetical protein